MVNTLFIDDTFHFIAIIKGMNELQRNWGYKYHLINIKRISYLLRMGKATGLEL